MAAVKRSLNVGVVGMGKMGVSITRNLAFKARSAMYLQIHSRTMSRARKVCDDLSVDGATCAMRLHDKYSTMSKWCDVMLLTLKDVEASRHVLLEHPDALLKHARRGQVIVDHTTVDIETSRECEEVARKRGAFFLDAPMSGSPKAAFNGQLSLMVGGDADTFQRITPIFHMYADQIHHMGRAGTGTAAKGINQMLVSVHNVAAAEAMKMAHELGVEDYQKLIQVLDASWGSSTMLRRNAPTMQELVRNPEKVPPESSATVDALLSDLDLLHEERRGMEGGEVVRGVDLAQYPLLMSSIRVLEAASHAGVGDRDIASVIHFLDAARNMEEQQQSDRHAVAADASAQATSAATAASAKAQVDEVEFY